MPSWKTWRAIFSILACWFNLSLFWPEFKINLSNMSYVTVLDLVKVILIINFTEKGDHACRARGEKVSYCAVTNTHGIRHTFSSSFSARHGVWPSETFCCGKSPFSTADVSKSFIGARTSSLLMVSAVEKQLLLLASGDAVFKVVPSLIDGLFASLTLLINVRGSKFVSSLVDSYQVCYNMMYSLT